MARKSLVTMLTVAAMCFSAVNSFATEAGVLGLKPSANWRYEHGCSKHTIRYCERSVSRSATVCRKSPIR